MGPGNLAFLLRGFGPPRGSEVRGLYFLAAFFLASSLAVIEQARGKGKSPWSDLGKN